MVDPIAWLYADRSANDSALGQQHCPALLQLQVIEDLVKKYKTVGSLLRKIEEVVTGTNNGKAPQLAGYYAYWERSIFSALNNMVLNAMRMLVTMLHARSAKKAAAAGLPARPPLFKVCHLHCYMYILSHAAQPAEHGCSQCYVDKEPCQCHLSCSAYKQTLHKHACCNAEGACIVRAQSQQLV